MSNRSPLLNVIFQSLNKVTRNMLRDFGEIENLQVSPNSLEQFVSKTEKQITTSLINDLTKSRPEWGIKFNNNTDYVKDKYYWIIDSLNGRFNFLHGLPHWAVSIALEHKGEIISGVIYDPCKDEMFFAEKGLGAWMNETRIRVSARHSIADSLYATGIPFSGRIEDLPETINDLKKLMPKCSGVRRYGAAALDLAYVAAGRYEGYWERNLNNWDIAGGVIIAREAGAMVESISINGDPLIDGNIIAATEVQFNKFAKIIRE